MSYRIVTRVSLLLVALIFRGHCIDVESDLAKSKSEPKHFKVLIIGSGMGGMYSAFQISKFESSVGLIESTSRICGNINDAEWTGSSDTHPLRIARCAARINIATMPRMRCLANELKIPVYFTPWATEYNMHGWKAKNWRFNYGLNYPTDKTKIAHYNGSSDLVFRGGGAWKLNTYEGTSGNPEDDAWGWLLGYPDYMNPAPNFNKASPLPWNSTNPSQDHPRWTCSKYKSVYALYTHYLGNQYADFVCKLNVGFIADCALDNDACSYLELNYAAYNQLDEGYPVGGMSEFCRREKSLAKASGVKFYYNEKVTKIHHLADKKHSNLPKYSIYTTKGKYTADNLILNVPPQAIASMSGSVIDSLLHHPEIEQSKNITALTLSLEFDSSVPAFWAPIIADLWASYRRISPSSCLNRIEILKTPYHKLLHGFRVAYTDFTCIPTWRHLIGLGQTALKDEILRQLQEEFYDVLPLGFQIPQPITVTFAITDTAWWYLQPGTPYTWQQIAKWATTPIGSHEKVCLAHSAYQIYYSGWAMSAINASDACLLRLFPDHVKQATVDNWKSCGGRFIDDNSVLPGYITPGINTQTDYSNGLSTEHFPPYYPNEQVDWGTV